MDITKWLAWFLALLHRAVDQAQHTLDAALAKTRFLAALGYIRLIKGLIVRSSITERAAREAGQSAD